MTKSATKIIFRADASNTIGMGHVIRSLALADMIKKDFDCFFAIQNPIEKIRELILQTCEGIIDLPVCSEESEAFYKELDDHISGDEIVVLDGYRFNTRYQSNVKQKGCHLVCIDDIHAFHFLADIVINHAVGFDRDEYSGEKYTRFFFGPAYALLRKEFLEAAKTRSVNLLKKEILVSLGGADPTNETLNVVKKIYAGHLFRKYKINIVIGAAYQHHEQLARYVKTTTDLKIVLYRAITAAQMVELMRRAEMAVCAPSTVTFEYVSVSEGKLFLVCIADNQKEFYKYLTSKKVALDFFNSFNDTVDETELSKMKELLDGKQDLRYLEMFAQLK